MTAMLIEVSSVIVANAHNPSILNHDWLIANEVLPDVQEGWEMAEPPFTTPPLSRIHYQNNVHIVLESGKLVITTQKLQRNVTTCPERVITEIARQYVMVLEHIPYVAAGNNFKAMIECEDAERRLISKFGGTGRWTNNLRAISTKLSYRLDGGCQRSIEIAADKVPKLENNQSKMIDVVIVSGNYHRDTPGKDPTLKAIAQAASDRENFLTFVDKISEDTRG